MIYGEWVDQEIARYARKLLQLERAYEDKADARYLHERASITQAIKMLEELAEPVESDPA